MAVDELWREFDFAMESANIGNYTINEGQAEDVTVTEVEAEPSTPCLKGEHQLIFNEQIGYTCKLCCKVVEEVKNILPCWATQSGQKSAKKNSFDEEGPSFSEFACEMTKSNGDQGSSSGTNGSVWDLIPGIYWTLYEHQRDAFEFIWKNLAGGIQLDLLKTCPKPEDVGGCVISHAPGTGKTRLAMVFIQSYMKFFPECRPVIIAPCGMLLTWGEEFKKWGVNLPFHVLNVADYSGKEDGAICQLVNKEPRNRRWIRLVKLYSWAKGDGVLGLSYGLFQRLTDNRSSNNLQSSDISKILLEKPGLLILDEGHTARNDHSLIWKALERVTTKQRIILSGTPFQNNFVELYNMLRLVRHEFLEKTSPKTLRLCQRTAELNPDSLQQILSGKNGRRWKLTTQIQSISDESLEEIRLLMKPFVHVYNGQILDRLPGIRDCLVILEPLPLQKCVLENIDDISSSSYLENEYKINLASVHPSLLTSVALSQREKSLIDENLLEKLRLNPNEGVKTRFIMEMIRLSKALKEKVIIFSQYLHSLSMIKELLLTQFNWTAGKEVLEIDGRIPPKHRQSTIDSFNDLSSDARVLLASTKACCEGICLTGASRVVMLDIVWNPSVEKQAISRAYRIGQGKVVYIYHLITSTTTEGDKYEKQAKKKYISKLVFSTESNKINMENKLSQTKEDDSSKLVSEDKILGEMTANDKIKDMFSRIYY